VTSVAGALLFVDLQKQ